MTELQSNKELQSKNERSNSFKRKKEKTPLLYDIKNPLGRHKPEKENPPKTADSITLLGQL